ncbi:jg27647 [Pararge aegeria aegeria]|uniref:Jg27647 protein n=1 Tax=Pararge aegeria aegeria TaxID=348720 RepID=A0A8S4R2M0_9NEOP|nr:jg27647 [Pararge aegeria aegeria]
MERAMLGVSLHNQIRNEEIHNRTKVNDIAQRVAKLKGGAHSSENRWMVGFQWRPRTGKPKVGRPAMRRTDNIKQVAGSWILELPLPYL